MPVAFDGFTTATDQVAGAEYQKIKLTFGADGSATPIANVAGSRLPIEIGGSDDNPIVLQASQVSGTTNATTTRTVTTNLGRFVDLQIIIKILSVGAATGTLQIFIQDSLDGGTIYDDLVASNTFAFGAAAINQVFSVSGRIATSKTQGADFQNEALAAGTARQGPWGDRIRIREKVSGVSGSPTGVTYYISAVGKR